MVLFLCLVDYTVPIEPDGDVIVVDARRFRVELGAQLAHAPLLAQVGAVRDRVLELPHLMVEIELKVVGHRVQVGGELGRVVVKVLRVYERVRRRVQLVELLVGLEDHGYHVGVEYAPQLLGDVVGAVLGLEREEEQVGVVLEVLAVRVTRTLFGRAATARVQTPRALAENADRKVVLELAEQLEPQLGLTVADEGDGHALSLGELGLEVAEQALELERVGGASRGARSLLAREHTPVGAVGHLRVEAVAERPVELELVDGVGHRIGLVVPQYPHLVASVLHLLEQVLVVGALALQVVDQVGLVEEERVRLGHQVEIAREHAVGVRTLFAERLLDGERLRLEEVLTELGLLEHLRVLHNQIVGLLLDGGVGARVP